MKTPIFILLYGVYLFYEEWSVHQQTMESLKSQIPPIENRIKKYKKEIKEIKFYLRDIEQAKENIELVAQEVEAIQKKFPENISDTENLGILKNIGNELGLEVTPTLGQEENKGFYFIRKYNIEATGTYWLFLNYLIGLDFSERIFNVKEVTLSRAQKRERGRFQKSKWKFTVESYRYNSNHKVDRGFARIEREVRQKQEEEKRKKREAKKKSRSKRKKKRKK